MVGHERERVLGRVGRAVDARVSVVFVLRVYVVPVSPNAEFFLRGVPVLVPVRAKKKKENAEKRTLKRSVRVFATQPTRRNGKQSRARQR